MFYSNFVSNSFIHLGRWACKPVSHFSLHQINPNEIVQLPEHAKLWEERAQMEQNYFLSSLSMNKLKACKLKSQT